MKPLAKVKTFTDRYPYLGPSIWMLSVQYFIVQLMVIEAWRTPFSWSVNVISDLGNTACGPYGSRFVCSPQHGLMNASFILLGVTMATGSLLIYQEFRETRRSLIGFSLMAAAGLGTLLVGIFPENTIAVVHTTGAFIAFAGGGLSMLILGLSLQLPRLMRGFTILAGAISLGALALYLVHDYAGLGNGGMERVVAYPQTIWLIAFGIYMSRNRYLHRRKK